MREQRGELSPTPRGNAVVDEASSGALDNVPPEVIEVLGEETCLAIEERVANLNELEGLRRHDNPAESDDRPSDLDLSKFGPSATRFIEGYGPNSNPNGFFKKLGDNNSNILRFRLARSGPKFLKKLKNRINSAIENLQEFGEELTEDSDRVKQQGIGVGIQGVKDRMQELDDRYEQLPPKSTFQTMKNIYSIALKSIDYRDMKLSQAKSEGKPVIGAGKNSGLTKGIRNSFNRRLSRAQVLDGHADDVREYVTGCFNGIIELVKFEQFVEAHGLLSIVETAHEQSLPEADQMSPQELAKATRAEAYIIEQAERVEDIFKGIDPEAMDSESQRTLTYLKKPRLTPMLEREQAVAKRALIGEKIITGITQAKNVLRGGGRLDPANEQDEDYVKRKAKDLFGLVDTGEQRLFEREESGVIMAIITDHFATFSEVVKGVKIHASNGNLGAFPSDRMDAVREIRGFDLDKALRKIRNIMQNPDLRIYIERVLDRQEIGKLKTELEEASKPQAS